MNNSPHRRSLEDALVAEFNPNPSPIAAAAMDRRVAGALAAAFEDPAGWRHRGAGLQMIAIAPVTAVIAALLLGIAAVTAALVLTGEDQRVVDLTACMRERGWQPADPDTAGGTGHVVPGFSTIVEEGRQDAFSSDLAACAANVGIPLQR